jgi:hypothetical protein
MKKTSRMLVLSALVLMTAQAWAGTSFRLEIGPAVADTSAGKVKNAVLLVRPQLCADPASVRITASAEGIVNGARQSVPLKLVALPTPGVHAVQRQWPDGRWVLHLSGTCPEPEAAASTIVPLTGTGNAFSRPKTQVLREPATKAQVEAALAEAMRGDS